MTRTQEAIPTCGVRPTLMDLLRSRAQSHPDIRAYTLLDGHGSESAGLSYGQLDLQARAIAGMLQRSRFAGKRVMLVYGPGLDFIRGFFGCIYAGATAIPVPPVRPRRGLSQLEAIATDTAAAAVLTTTSALSKAQAICAELAALNSLAWLSSVSVADSFASDWTPPIIDEGSLAYLQYTSGSTGSPRGVMITHANVMHNLAELGAGWPADAESVYVTWLPHFHDMGLVYGIIAPLYEAKPCYMIAPAEFLQHPESWLRTISRYHATHSGGPNFAYDLCARRIPQSVRDELDLSTWKVAFNGAEPIRKETLTAFAHGFASCGFRLDAFCPGYGLAEATLKVSSVRRGQSPRFCAVESAALENNTVRETIENSPGSRTLVSCGAAERSTRIAIVRPDSLTICEADEVGEIWVMGAGVASGYWNEAAGSEQTFGAHIAESGEGPYLRTGDLGFIRDGELYVTGRLKDMIIIGGRNHYSEDIEITVECSHRAIRPHSVAAFSDDAGSQERLVVAAEIERRYVKSDAKAIVSAIVREVSLEHEASVSEVVLLRPGTIRKTTSGKIARSACKKALSEAALEPLHRWRAPDIADDLQLEPDAWTTFDTQESIAGWIAEQAAGRVGVLNEPVDIHQPAIAYGLDSMSAVAIAHKLQARVGIYIPMAEFLDGSSISELAARISRQLRDTDANKGLVELKVESGVSRDDGTGSPLSHGQRGIWFLYQLDPASPAYNVTTAMRIAHRIDDEALRQAFEAVVARHECLRSRFKVIDGEPVQQIASEHSVDFQVKDASAWSDSSFSEALLGKSCEPFDLERGPLLRVRLYRRPEESHVLLLCVHHIVCDFWSLSIVVRELGELYRAQDNASGPGQPMGARRKSRELGEQLVPTIGDLPTKGRPHPVLSGRAAPTSPSGFEPDTISWSYSDYVRWQESVLGSATGDELWNYWSRRLGGELPDLDLPLDRPRPAMQSFRGASFSFEVDEETSEGLKQLAKGHGATLFMTVLAAFEAFLYRYTGQEDFCVGSPASGRSRAELEWIVGYFVNSLVLRAEVKGDSGFDELHARTRNTVLGAIQHQDFPFALLVKRLQRERDPSRSPLFQVMFTLQKAHIPDLDPLSYFALGERGGRLKVGALELESIRLQQRIAQFDIQLMMAETSGGMAASLEYNTDLFDHTTIQRMAAHFQSILNTVVEDGEIRIAELPILSARERAHLVAEWNDTGTEFPKYERFQKAFEHNAVTRPDAISCVYADQQLAYRELNSRAGQLAGVLERSGARAESIVAVLGDRSPAMLVSILAIFKAGAVYLPLDPKYPEERIRRLLDQSGCRIVILCSPPSDNLPNALALHRLKKHITVFESEDTAQANDYYNDGGAACSPENLAYVIFTSGSTGTPKGAMVEHRGLLNHLNAKILDLELTCEDEIIQSASQCFDISIWQFLAALVVGGRTHIVDDETARDPLELFQGVEASNVTILEIVPALLSSLFDGADLTLDRVPTLTSLRWLVVTGEALPAALCRQWLNAFPSIPILNAYGPTECSDDVTHHAIRASEDAGSVHAPIGYALANMRAYVVDRDMNPGPMGMAGELVIGGAGVGRGYLDDPARTADAFVPDPFKSTGGARMYRTGDLARCKPDGRIDFRGRIDFQVKVRGFRIELGEIEAALLRHSAVREAIVIAGETGRGRKKLVAYIVPSDKAGPNRDELSAFLKNRLPEYMIPAHFVVLDHLPRTANGKVDRRALPKPDSQDDAASSSGSAARTRLQEQMTRIWKQVLQVDEIGIHENFFEIGGDSILSIKVVSRARQEGLEISPRDIFEAPTIAGLAAIARPIKTRTEQPDLTGEIRLSPIQHWFFEQEFKDAHHWNLSLLLSAPRQCNGAALEQAVQRLYNYHDELRARFVKTEGGWRQFIGPPGRDASTNEIDVSRLSRAEGELIIQSSAAELQASLDLSEGPLLRIAILRQAGVQRAEIQGVDTTARVLVVLHHLIADIVSLQILLDDLDLCYRLASTGLAMDLPPKTAPFGAWTGELFKRAGSQDLRREVTCWSTQTDGQVVRLPVDLQGGVNSEGSARTLTVWLGRDETASFLTGLTAQYRVQPRDVLLAAVAHSIGQWAGTRSIVIEMEGHGRDATSEDLDVSRTVGWFTSSFPLLLETTSSNSPVAELRAVKEAVRKIPANGNGYGMLRYLAPDAAVREKARGATAPEVLFNYIGDMDLTSATDSGFTMLGQGIGPARSERALRTHPLEVNAGISGSGLRIDWTYSENLHTQATIDRVAQSCLDYLESLITYRHAEGRVLLPSDFPLAEIDPERLADLERLGAGLEDIYPLTPVQQGILFHTTFSSTTGVYWTQLVCGLNGRIEMPAFANAWQSIVDRHAVLRTGFDTLGAEPLQIVQSRATITIEEKDCRNLPEDCRAQLLEALLDQDRERRCDLAAPPLMRLLLIRAGDREHILLWSFHHLVMDGWSLAVVLEEALALYRAYRRGESVRQNPPGAFRDQLVWLRQQDQQVAEAFWRERLSGFAAPTGLGIDSGPAGSESEPRYAELTSNLAKETTTALQAVAHRNRVTLNTLMQGAYALLLARYSGSRDVVYGFTSSGRDGGLIGAESRVGPYINTIPLRIEIRPEELAWSWLKGLQRLIGQTLQYSYSPLNRIQRWSDVPAGTPLFESIFVFENYPGASAAVNPAILGDHDDLRITNIRSIEQTNYPLTITVIPGPEFNLNISYDANRFEAQAIERMFGHIEALLRRLATAQDLPLASFEILTDSVLAFQSRSLPVSHPYLPRASDRKTSPEMSGRAEPSPQSLRSDRASLTEVEKKLVRAWGEALDLEHVGIHDNFFEIGGDSIVSMRVVSKARKLGLALTPKQLFAHPTIVELAKSIRMARPSYDGGRVPEGEVPLTPVQAWFFAQNLANPSHYNQAIALEIDASLSLLQLEDGIRRLFAHHDAFRLRFNSERTFVVPPSGGVFPPHDAFGLRFKRERTGWRQFYAPRKEPLTLAVIDLSLLDDRGQAVEIDEITAGTQASLDLENGPLARAVLLQLPEPQAPLLLLAAHHLVIDAVSWRILLEDLQAILDALAGGWPINLLPPSTSFKQWAESLQKYAESDRARAQAEYWISQGRSPSYKLPRDRPGQPNTMASERTVTVALDYENTQFLLREAPALLRARVDEILVTALALTLTEWTAQPGCLISIEGHGRHDIQSDIDVSRTIGWFTSIYPVLIDAPGTRRETDVNRETVPRAPSVLRAVATGTARREIDVLRTVKQRMRSTPDGGLGYGALRFLAKDRTIKDSLNRFAEPDLCFNYLGQLDLATDKSDRFRVSHRNVGPMQDSRNQRSHLLEVEAGVIEGELRIDWFYSETIHTRKTIERLGSVFVDRVRVLLSASEAEPDEACLRSDFALVELDRGFLERVRTQSRDIEDVYPLAPVQEGLLFHSLYEQDSGLYSVQLVCEISGCINLSAFGQGWQHLLSNHAALRAGFESQGSGAMVQVIWRQARLVLDFADWGALGANAQQSQFERFLARDRHRPIALNQPPLMRMTLIRFAEHEYRMVWTCHHLIMDGWSIGIVLRDVFSAYAAARGGQQLVVSGSNCEAPVGAALCGRPLLRRSATGSTDQYYPTRNFRRAPLAAGPQASYRDYIDWLRRQDRTKAREYWRAALGNRESQAKQHDYSGQGQFGQQETCLSEQVTERLKRAGIRGRVTTSVQLEAAFALLLSRCNRGGVASYGRVVSGRSDDLPGVDTLAGCFINTVPAQTVPDGSAGVADWLAGIQSRRLEAREFEYCSLGEIQEWIGAAKTSSLFDSIFVFENYPIDASVKEWLNGRFTGFQIKGIRSIERTNYPLVVSGLPGDRLTIEVAYHRARYDDVCIARMLQHFTVILDQIASNHAISVSDLELLTFAERHQILVEWNDTSGNGPLDLPSIPSLFRRQVNLRPEAIAIVANVDHISYAELDDRANNVAALLGRFGVGPETVVALCLERSVDLILVLLGTLKAGGAYLSLDPSYPLGRREFMIRDSRPAVLVTDARLGSQFHDLAIPMLCLNGGIPQIGSESRQQPPVEPAADNVAYVTYTSGTTGSPKGVALTHRSVVRLVREPNYARLGPGEALLQNSTISFDPSTFEIWGSLLNGAKLIIMPPELASLADLANAIRQYGITTLWLTSGLFHLMVDEHLEALSQLDQLLAGGEALSPGHVDRYLRSSPRGKLINGYGPTENTTFTCCYTLGLEPDPFEHIPIGRPVSETGVYIAGSGLSRVPIGSTGELYTSGSGLARGYLNNPDLTAEKFLPDPFSSEPGGRMYATGDLTTYLASGAIEFLGRIDDQVKVRGFRVEPAEIEAAMRSIPGVRQCLVRLIQEPAQDAILRHKTGNKQLVVSGSNREGRVGAALRGRPLVGRPPVARTNRSPSFRDFRRAQLVAYLTSNGSIDLASVRRSLKDRLPDFMIPSSFVLLDQFPMTTTGKVDRAALPMPQASAIEDRERFTPPRTYLEDLLSGVWAGILDAEAIGPSDNFFDLGGDSIRALRVVSRIQQALGLNVQLRELFDAPTIASLAKKLEAQMGGVDETVVPIVAHGKINRAPLSFAQERLWFLQQLYPESWAYNIPSLHWLRGRLNRAALLQALGEVVRRHEILRTGFVLIHGQPSQVVSNDAGPLSLAVDLTSCGRAAAVRGLAEAEAERPFDLTAPPLIRIALISVDEDEHALLVNVHHIAADGWSVQIFARELTGLYEAFGAGAPSALKEPEVQYSDFSLWQRQYLTPEVMNKHLSYWRDALGTEARELNLPIDRQRPPARSFSGGTRFASLSADLSDDLRSLARQEAVTPFMVLLAGFHSLLYRYTGQRQIRVGIPVANRNRWEIENLIGFFGNVVIARSNTDDATSFRALLGQIRTATLEAQAHQDLPFEMLVDDLQPERDLSLTPLFQVVFSYHPNSGPLLRLAGISTSSEEVETRSAKFDLTMQVEEAEREFLVSLEYYSDVFEAQTVDRMLGHFDVLLSAVLASPEIELMEAPLMPSQEREMVLRSSTARLHSPSSQCIHQLFESQNAARPDAASLVDGQHHLSYLELNRRANRLAHCLRASGIGPESLVAICLDRSAEMIVSILAVLKSGGAYVPLDPRYPADRLAFMVKNSGTSLLLTRSEFLDLIQSPGLTTLCIDRFSQMGQWADQNPTTGAIPENAAYVIYTSGSTGRPKGTVVTHSNLDRLFKTTEQMFGFGEDDVWVLFHSYAFDFSVWEMWGALLYGGRLIVVPYHISMSPEAFYEMLVEEQVTILNQTPSALGRLIRIDRPGSEFGALRTVILGGEALEIETLKPWLARPAATDLQIPALVNMYGITETTVHVTYKRIDRAELIARAGSSVGNALPDLGAFVLDERLGLAPIGVPGEIFVAGAGVARGYVRRPDLTAERFIPNPYSARSGDRLYRSGDLGKYTVAGELEHLGRVDQQVKVRGFRIEPCEIEAALLDIPGITAAKVLPRTAPATIGVRLKLRGTCRGGPRVPSYAAPPLGRQISHRKNQVLSMLPGLPPSTTSEKTLVAYVVKNGSIDTKDIRSHLKKTLPDYMIPAAIVNLESLPLTSNGKLDVAALPNPEYQPAAVSEAFDQPETELEKSIAAIWQDVLGVPAVGLNDNFFDLGGNSVSIAVACARIRDDVGREVSVVDMFTYTSVSELSGFLGGNGHQQAPARPDEEELGSRKRALSRRGKLREQQRAKLEG
jgi:amino acid adenylation domain-containing protein/non-ribosomal peptide synthase protein (TIGR01720 family)